MSLSPPGTTSTRRGPAAGFTLIEVLIASTILAITVGALVYPFSLAHEQQRLDASRTTAAALAAQMIERMVDLPYDQVLAMNGRVEVGDQITGGDDSPIGDPSLTGYTLSVAAGEVTVGSGDEAATFCSATVVVSHPQIRAVTYSRLFAPTP